VAGDEGEVRLGPGGGRLPSAVSLGVVMVADVGHVTECQVGSGGDAV
jgi:hypothetical protein